MLLISTKIKFIINLGSTLTQMASINHAFSSRILNWMFSGAGKKKFRLDTGTWTHLATYNDAQLSLAMKEFANWGDL